MGVHRATTARKKMLVSIPAPDYIRRNFLLAILYLEEAPPQKKDKYTQAKEDYWASR